MTTLIIARHGNTFGPDDTPTRVGARTDIPLVEKGREQAKAIGKYLREQEMIPDVVYASKLKRAIETAEIAVQASLTGHLVMSTLHTNTAVGAVTRLMDMGVEPFLLSSSLVGVLAQRLVRTLCPDCRAPRSATKAERKFLKMEEFFCEFLKLLNTLNK